MPHMVIIKNLYPNKRKSNKKSISIFICISISISSIYLYQLLDSQIEQFYKFALRYSTTFIQF